MDSITLTNHTIEIEVKRRHKQQADRRENTNSCLTHCLVACAIRSVYPDTRISVGLSTAQIDNKIYQINRDGQNLIYQYMSEDGLDIMTLPQTIQLRFDRELQDYD